MIDFSMTLFRTDMEFYVEYPTKPPKCWFCVIPSFVGSCLPHIRQIRTAAISPQCLSLGHDLPIDLERGGRMAACDHY